MDNKELYDMCVKLAKRYNDKNHFDDLVSEAVVACLEARVENDQADFHTIARRAMSDYIQIKILSVTVPINGTTRRPDFKEQFNGSCGVEEYMIQVDDCYVSFELKDMLRKLRKEVTDLQWETIEMLYKYNNDVKRVADEMGRSRQAVEKTRNSVREKILFLS